MNRPIYLDYMATTPADPQVAKVINQHLTLDGDFGNPSSKTHLYGDHAGAAVDNARQHTASLINAPKESIFWTSGATEANNLAIQGAMASYSRQGRHMVTAMTEHKAVLDICQSLETQGVEVTYLRPDSNGHISLNQLEEAIRDDTVLVSLMHVNNETGVIHDIHSIAQLVKRKGVLLHVDAAQSLGKVPVDLNQWPVDLMSMSAHKFYGPKGIGALYIRQRPKVRLKPLFYGGGHQGGIRPGTLPAHQIAGMGEACRLASQLMEEDNRRIIKLRQQLAQTLTHIGGVHFNGDMDQRVPHNLNVSFEGVNGEALLYALKDIAVSTGSACTSATLEPSHVLKAMGLDDALSDTAIRISLGRFTTQNEIDHTCRHISRAIHWLRGVSGYSNST